MKQLIIIILISLMAGCSKSNPKTNKEKNQKELIDTQEKFEKWFKETHKDTLVKQRTPTRQQKLSYAFAFHGPFAFIMRWETGQKAPFAKGTKLCHDVKGDRGGLTCAGLSYRAHKKFYHDLPCPLEKEKLNKFFHTRWGQRRLADYYFENYGKVFFFNCKFPLSFFLTDASVLSGPGNIIKMYQRINGLNPDGIFGKKTKKACSRPSFSGSGLKTRLDDFYKNIVEKDPTQKKFLKGWLRRSRARVLFLKEQLKNPKKESEQFKNWKN